MIECRRTHIDELRRLELGIWLLMARRGFQWIVERQKFDYIDLTWPRKSLFNLIVR